MLLKIGGRVLVNFLVLLIITPFLMLSEVVNMTNMIVVHTSC